MNDIGQFHPAPNPNKTNWYGTARSATVDLSGRAVNWLTSASFTPVHKPPSSTQPCTRQLHRLYLSPYASLSVCFICFGRYSCQLKFKQLTRYASDAFEPSDVYMRSLGAPVGISKANRQDRDSRQHPPPPPGAEIAYTSIHGPDGTVKTPVRDVFWAPYQA